MISSLLCDVLQKGMKIEDTRKNGYCDIFLFCLLLSWSILAVRKQCKASETFTSTFKNKRGQYRSLKRS